jgi:hypothetical protein
MMNIAEDQPSVERVDDIPVIYGLLERMGIQGIVDRVITPHGNWSGLSPGWVVTLWLVHILSEQNHLMEPVQQWVARHELLLSTLSGQPLRALDFSDDRLAICLRALSARELWQQIESDLGLRLIRVYDLSGDVVRLDATVGTVHHDPGQQTLFQVGKAKNGLFATQFKVMLASLDPLGLPLAVDVEPGNRADDPLYLPSYQRAKQILVRDGLLVVGDSKMSALLTRANIVAGADSYLVPLADQKDAPQLLPALLTEWRAGGAAATLLFRPDDQPEEGGEPDPQRAIARGFEVTRAQSATVGESDVRWEERLLLIRSDSYMISELRPEGTRLHRRLNKAAAALMALTPPKGRGKKQMTQEGAQRAAIEQVEKKYRVQGQP